MVNSINGVCSIYTKINDNDFYTQIYKVSGNVSSILSSGLYYLKNAEEDKKYNTFYLLITPLDYRIDDNIANLDDIIKLNPVVTIKPNKTVGSYESELQELQELSGITNVGSSIKNLMSDYKDIIRNFNTSYNSTIINDNFDDIIDCIDKLITVSKSYKASPYKILQYIDSKYYDGKISDSVVSMVYEKFGLTLNEFIAIVKEYDLNIEDIRLLLRKMAIDGNIQIKKKIFLKTLEKMK